MPFSSPVSPGIQVFESKFNTVFRVGTPLRWLITYDTGVMGESAISEIFVTNATLVYKNLAIANRSRVSCTRVTS